jgi:hypothetical protein
MVKILKLLTIFSFSSSIVAVMILFCMSQIWKLDLPDKFASLIFLPIGFVFIFGILGNAADGGRASVLGKDFNRTDNPILYWCIAFPPFAVGVVILLIGINLIIK